MRGLLSLLYGLAAYAAAMATLAYFVGFSANLFVPKSVDVGGGATTGVAVLTDLLLLALFGIQHSVMARQGFKRWWTRVVPPAVERSTYLLATCVVMALLFRFWVPIAQPVAWRVESGAGQVLLWALFAAGCLLAMASSYFIDHWELFGLRQVLARWRGRRSPDGEFRTPLLYRYVRHPLYVGFLLSLWAFPVMTAGRLLLAAGLSAYILVGIFYEERDLVRLFGDRYRRYRERVGMLLPRTGSSERT